MLHATEIQKLIQVISTWLLAGQRLDLELLLVLASRSCSCCPISWWSSRLVRHLGLQGTLAQHPWWQPKTGNRSIQCCLGGLACLGLPQEHDVLDVAQVTVLLLSTLQAALAEAVKGQAWLAAQLGQKAWHHC